MKYPIFQSRKDATITQAIRQASHLHKNILNQSSTDSANEKRERKLESRALKQAEKALNKSSWF